MAAVVAMVVAFSESALYGVLAPSLPALVSELHLSPAEAGGLSSAYPAGMVVAAIPAGYATRFSASKTATFGIWLLAAASAGFALADSGTLIIMARFVQGAGACAAWAGALAWSVRSAPSGAHGSILGRTFSAAFMGSLIAPAAALLASLGQRSLVFMVAAIGLVGVALWAGRQEEPDPVEDPPVELGGDRPGSLPGEVAEGVLAMLVVGVVFGVVQAFVPLQLADRGAGAAALSATVLCAYAPQIFFSHRVGGIADRRGARLPLIWALVVIVACFPLLASTGGALVGCVLMAVLMFAALTTFASDAALVSAGSAGSGNRGLALSLIHGAWAIGAVVGAGGSIRLADSWGAGTAYLTAAAICAVAVVGLVLRQVQTNRSARSRGGPALGGP